MKSINNNSYNILLISLARRALTKTVARRKSLHKITLNTKLTEATARAMKRLDINQAAIIFDC